MLTLVYAQDLNGAIGYENHLPWTLPKDVKFFKEVTMGHPILMGIKTFDSLNQRLLPGRQSVVVTRDQEYGKDIEGLTVVHSIDEILELGKDQEIMVIGGAEVFKMVWEHTDQIIRTLIEDKFSADTFMPELDRKEWRLSKVIVGEVDEKNPYKHQFEWWQRREPASE